MLKGKVRQAQEYIASLSGKGRLVVNFSGGKDSVTVLLLAMEVSEPVAWFMDTNITLPGTVQYVQNICKKLGASLMISHPDDYKGDFYVYVKKYRYFPCVSRPWCSIKLKIRPQRAKMRQLWGKETVFKLTGVRRAESLRRMAIYRRNKIMIKDPEHSGSFTVHPILNWTDEDVRQYLESQGIEHHKGYKQFGVSGCFYCPFYQRRIYERILKVYPTIYDKIIALEKEIGKPSVVNHQWLWQIKQAVETQKKLTPFIHLLSSSTTTIRK